MPSESASSWRERRKQLREKRRGEEDLPEDENELEALSEQFLKGPNKNRNYSDRSTKDNYVPHVSAAKRMRMEREAVFKSVTGEDMNAEEEMSSSQQRSAVAKERKKLAAMANAAPANNEEGNDQMDENIQEEEESEEAAKSLLLQAAKLKQSMTEAEREQQAQKEEEQRILKEASKVQTNALQAASELAHGVVYNFSLPTSWTCPSRILKQGEEQWNKIRNNWHILVEGHDIPPPMKSFVDMRFPKPIIDFLQKRNIKRPTPIQMQGLPVALAGRDMVGIAFTGSGKTMTFSLPLVMAALEEEVRMPLVGGEGPVGIILAPSRELVRQTYELVQNLCEALASAGFPQIRSQLVIGGENARDQLQPFRDHGVHCVVATPGRLRDFLKKKSITLDICRYICLDEADRMLDLGFDEEVGEIMNHFKHQRQTLLFSATFPKKFQDFAKQTLVKPIVVNVGRAGAANLDVIQEVEYVKQEAKIVYLLECLQKTAPPVIIFCERKGDVDDIHEYLLLKGVEAVSIHGGKDQAERNEAIQLFKEGQKDVLIATDIAAKGLDFADIQHVINFDMPSEIENYVHRIGRTGRCGKTGVATTFINKSCEETTLLDLKHLLKEAHQRIPPVLMIMEDPLENIQREDGSKGCSFCGGLGHSIVDCPKIDKDARRVTRKDALASGDGYGGDW
ncbi:DEAD/DEAH box RNA helicase [Chaetoceros tenuissimus]|uniref:RNA helicase n=1 Tax=Chaetoceros tenuissimus TaxID=426638 RepID=A0AAD3H232_9STRA|nr:DEAD/DEAH box RNA helicase [Chaetoceros tenuissimus]